MGHKINFFKFVKLWGVVFLISLAVILIGFEIINTYRDYQLRADEMRRDYTMQQKEMVKHEVAHVVDMINYRIERIDNVKEQTKNEILEKISKIRFGKEGYIFINKLNGDALVSNGKIYSGMKKLWEIFPNNQKKIKMIFNKEYNAALKPDGGYIHYSFIKLTNSNKEAPKVSFIYGIPNLHWIVGAGVYLDDIENNISIIKSELSSKLEKELFYSILVVIMVIALFLVLFNMQLDKLKNDFKQFNRFFKRAAHKNEPIDLTSIKFIQLEEMAKKANNMLQEKALIQKKLFDEREKLFVTIRSVGDGLITTDNAGKIELMNKVAENLTGWKNKEAKGKFLTEIFNIINETTKEPIENPVSRVLTENKIVGLANHTILIAKDGNEHNIADSAAPIKDLQDNVQGVVLVFRDITQDYKMQDELKESEEKFKSLMQQSPFVVELYDLKGLQISVNKAYEELWGYPGETTLNKFNILESKEVEKSGLMEYVKLAYTGKSVTVPEYTFDPKGDTEGLGRVRWLSTKIYPVKDKLGKVKNIVVTHQDITERKHAEEALKQSKERYSRLSSLTYEGIAIHKKEIVIDINSAFEKILGYTAEEVIGKNIIDLAVPQKHHKTMYEMMRNNVTAPYEIEGIRKDGSIIQLELESRNSDSKNGKSNVRVTAVRDITQRKKNEYEILKLSNAIEQAHVNIVITDIKGDIEYVNPKFTEVTGYSLKEVLHKNTRLLKSNEQSKEFYTELWNTILSGKAWSGEFLNKKKSGELFWESAKISPIINKNGEITNFVAVKEDITEMKKMLDELVISKEKAVSADKMKSIFLAQMSHEIRTPISAMISLSSLLRDDLADKVDEDYKLSFDMINRAGMRIVRTVDLLLNLSEIQAGTYEVINKSFNLYADILGKIIVEYKKRAKDKGLLLDIDIGTDNTEIVADSYTVDQIFTQLIDNAIKYTNEGKINIRIYRNEEEKLIAEITDTGIGIGQEYLADLFTPFSQEEMGYTRKYEGNGIGLTLVKKYCEMNNAMIDVESAKGVGSTFKIIF